MKTDLTLGKVIRVMLIICIFFIDPICNAQTTVKVSDPRLEMIENTIHIYYDILNSNPDDKYTVNIDIMDEDGNKIKAKALDGDLGVVEEGGRNKLITWDLDADNIILDAYIFVQIHAKVIPPPEPVTTEQADETKQETVIQEEDSRNLDTDESITSKETPHSFKSMSFTRTGIILQSLAVPGLGLSRVTGNPHWIRGAAGYGCLAGSVLLNRQAINTFNQIDELIYFDDISSSYDKSLRQDNISEILCYTAIGIWVTDIIWTIVGTSDLSKGSLNSETNDFSIRTTIDPLSYAPMLGIRYRF